MAGIKLRAEDEEDLAVVSAVLQDALVSVAEMVYRPEEKRFVLVANRFRWEPEAEGARRNFERILTGLRIDAVTNVRRRGFDPRDQERILNLLAIRAEPGALRFEFAAGASIRLEVERILCHLDDLGEPWPTRWQPKHPVADAE